MVRRRGFTLIDLLVVVAILVLLAALLSPSITRNPGRAILARCALHLKAQGNAFFITTQTNNGIWPASPAKVDSLCQQTIETRDALSASMGTAPSINFYCPANKAQDPAALWTGRGGVSTWGYVWFNDRGTAGTALPATFPSRDVPLEYIATANNLHGTRPSQAVLALDVIVTDTPTAPLNYAPKAATVTFGSSHIPAGKPANYINVLFADGHVAGVQFNPSKATAIAQPAGGFFWVPAPEP